MESLGPTSAVFDVFNRDCPSRRAFDQIFSRWGILILTKLSLEPLRFGVLRRAIDGISEKMLAETLQVLEEEGVVLRTDWDVKPPRVEYSLTPAGVRISKSLSVVIGDLYRELETRPLVETRTISGR